jgi:hypothetical protein
MFGAVAMLELSVASKTKVVIFARDAGDKAIFGEFYSFGQSYHSIRSVGDQTLNA